MRADVTFKEIVEKTKNEELVRDLADKKEYLTYLV